MPPIFGPGKEPGNAVSRKRGSKRDTADGHDHADGHRRSDREARRKHAPGERVAHDEGGERTGNEAGHEGETLSITA